MIAAIGRRQLISALLVVAMAMPGIPVSGLSAWVDAGTGFAGGAFDGTAWSPGGVRLATQLNASDEWRHVGSEGPARGSRLPAVYDTKNDLFVLFGNPAHLGGPIDNPAQTWVFYPGSDTWEMRHPAFSPNFSDAMRIAMAYDERAGKTILLYNTFVYFENNFTTWAYDAAIDEWTNLNTTTRPRYDFWNIAMAYSPKAGVSVLYGEYDSHVGSKYRGETWAYNYSQNSWTNLSPPATPDIEDPVQMVYDSRQDLFIMVYAGDSDVEHTYTYAYDYGANKWRNLIPSNAPGWRESYGLAYDYGSGLTVLFGGERGGPALNDTWGFNYTLNAWAERKPPGAPSGRLDAAMAGDSRRGGICMFVGSSSWDDLGNAWSYDCQNDSWKCLNVAPGSRYGPAMAYDEKAGRAVLFGGLCENGAWQANDTWLFDSATETWRRAWTASQPVGRDSAAMIYDSRLGRCILYGGYAGWGNTNIYYDDLWTFNASSGNWTREYPDASPGSRSGHALAYDEKAGLAVLFGGAQRNARDPFNDTWTYNSSAVCWTPVHPAVSPPARSEHALAYDRAAEKTVMFGGANGSAVFNDTWAFDAASGEWTRMNPASAPSPRAGHAMIWSEELGGVVLVGGTDRDIYYNDTWLYNVTSDSWTGLSAAGPFIGRESHCLITEGPGGPPMLFGGAGGVGGDLILGDAWMRGGLIFQYEGTFDSVPFDTGGTPNYGTLRWNATVPASGSLMFQVRSGHTAENLANASFTGPDGNRWTYYEASGQALADINFGKRWVQYRAFFARGDRRLSPVLEGVTVSYNLFPHVSVSSPQSGGVFSGLVEVAWNASDPDNDTLSFDIWLYNEKNASDRRLLAGGLGNDVRNWTWDTSGTENGAYCIGVLAHDLDPELPVQSEYRTGNFSIFHPPPPNHPPSVWLLEPENGSVVEMTSVRFRWAGSDPDGDPLNFSLRYWRASDGIGGMRTVDATGMESPVDGLDDGAAYCWTVVASDGSADSGDIAPVWSFSVRVPPLPPINHPPNITSVPPEQAFAEEALAYNVTAVDADGDVLAYSIIGDGMGAALDAASGAFRWTPERSQEGNRTFTILASDGRGGSDRQAFTVLVLVRPEPPVPVPPQCRILFPGNGTLVTGTISVRGTAGNGSRALTLVQYRLDGGDWKAAPGLYNWRFRLDTARLANGGHLLEARAFDGEFYSPVSTVVFEARNGDQGTTLVNQGWCLPAALLAGCAGLVFFVLVRRKRMP